MSLPKFDFFQTDSEVVLTILKRGVDLASCKVSFSVEDPLRITVSAGEDTIFTGKLLNAVKQGDVTVKVTPSKVEVHLPKERGGRWDKLLQEEEKEKAGGSTGGGKKNWDALEKQVQKEEEEEELTGDAAVNRMFKKIYQDADEDTRRAMLKSYQESAGTVLSTNWKEIGAKKTDIKPPDCMEYKKYDQ